MLFAGLLLGLAATAYGKNILELTKKADYDAAMESVKNSDKKILVAYKAKWCSHCEHMFPNLKQAAELNQDNNIEFAFVECTENRELCKDVRGYPTIIGYKKSGDSIEKKDFAQSRTAESFMQFMKDF